MKVVHFDENTSEVICPQCIISGGTWCLLVLPGERGVCQVASKSCYFCPFIINRYLWGDTLTPTSFSIYWWFLPKITINMLAAKGWFNFSIISSFIIWLHIFEVYPVSICYVYILMVIPKKNCEERKRNVLKQSYLSTFIFVRNLRQFDNLWT